jgi:hypothetical protein
MIPTVLNTIAGGIVSIVALTGQAQSGEPFAALAPGMDSCRLFLQVVDDEHKARPRNAEPNVFYTMGYLSFESYARGFLSGAKGFSNARR